MFIERRNALVTGLREYLRKVFPGLMLVQLNPDAPRPDYPFVAFEPIVLALCGGSGGTKRII